MKVRTGLGLVAAAIALVAGGCVIPIEDLGGPTSVAWGINDAGVIIGTSQLAGAQPTHFTGHAYTRHPDGSVLDLGTLPGHDNSEGRAINASGTATGTSYGSWTPTPGATWPSSLVTHAVVWDPSGVITDLGTLDGESTSEPRDINAAGVVVGESGVRAFVFDPAVGHMVELPTPPGGHTTVALGINDLGIAVGYTYVDNDFTPLRWDLGAGTVEDLSSTLDAFFVPRQINNRGTMAGEVAGGPSWSVRSQAAVVPAGTTTPINLGVSATETSFAPGLNEQDVVAGVRYLDTGGHLAFRWSAADGVEELTDEPTSFAFGINDGGTIVGTAGERAAILVAMGGGPGATSARASGSSFGSGASPAAGPGGHPFGFPGAGAFD